MADREDLIHRFNDLTNATPSEVSRRLDNGDRPWVLLRLLTLLTHRPGSISRHTAGTLMLRSCPSSLTARSPAFLPTVARQMPQPQNTRVPEH